MAQRGDGSFLHRLGGFLFPAACVGCGATAGQYVCTSCRSSFHPSRSLVAGAELLTLGDYDGVLQACLTAVKNKGHRSLGLELAELAAARVHRCWAQQTASRVYSIQPSRAGQRLRGFSLPLMMQQAVLRSTGWSALEDTLASRFPDSQQSSHGLNLEERLARQAGRRAVVSPAEGAGAGPLLILDDVVTTGATLSHAVGTARELGFEPVRLFALAVAADG